MGVRRKEIRSMKSEFPILSRAEQGKILLVFALLSAIYAYPVLSNISAAPVGDGALQAHSFWWLKTMLGNFKNPYYSDYFFYPQVANLAFNGPFFSYFVITLPISILFGVNEAVNVGHFLGYLLSGYFTFLLAYDLTNDKQAAVIAGIIYAFMPYHVSHVPMHTILSSLQWIPLYLLFLHRALGSDDKKWSLCAGLGLATVILSDQHQTVMALIITAALLPFMLFTMDTSDNRRRLRLNPNILQTMGKLLIIISVSALASSFYIYPVVEQLMNSQDMMKKELFESGGANQYSADILAYLIPPDYNPLWGKSVTTITKGWNNTQFLGYLPLCLAAFGGITCFRAKNVRFIVLFSLTGLILSLGVSLHVAGVWEWDGAHYKLPFYYLSDLPIFSAIRSPFRFHPLTGLGVALLASFGTVSLLQRIRSRISPTTATTAVAVIILMEFLPGMAPFPQMGPIPKIYHEMAKDKEVYTVLELPLSRWTSFVRNGSGTPAPMMYYQSVHGKKIFNGFTTRMPDETMIFWDTTLEALKDVSRYHNYVLVGAEKRDATAYELTGTQETARERAPLNADFLKRYNVHYVILHYPINSPGSMTRMFVETLFGRPMIDVPEDALAYMKII